MKKEPMVLHPFLFAAYPIIFLYAYNIQSVHFREVAIILSIMTLFSAMILYLMKLIFKDIYKAAVMTSLSLVLFFSYGHLYNLITYFEKSTLIIGRYRYLLSFYLVIFISVAYYVRKTRNELNNLTKILNFTAIVLFFMSLIDVGVCKFESYKNRTEIKPVIINSKGQPAARPDIYCIILDEYAGPGQIKQVYNYDNSGFFKRLIKKGFYIAEKSRTQDSYTWNSLAALLNMKFPEGRNKPDDMVSNNAVVKFLKSKGYKYIHFGSWWSATISNPYADANFSVNFLESEFTIVLANTTIIRPLLSIDFISRNRILYNFDKLAEVPYMDMGGPKFVFAHIISPHTPFVFGPNGEKPDMKDAMNWRDKSFYLGQYIFITKKTEELVDAILSKSKNSPIIIIQSDHGVRKHSNFDIGDSRYIFNALYLPGYDKSVLYPSLPPVDTFRIIFNIYFDTDFELL